MQSPPKSTDLLLVIGTNDTGVAEHAANICKTNEYTHIIVSDGVFHECWQKATPYRGTEAVVFAEFMVDRGVSSKKIICESAATNTGENVTLSPDIATGQLVHKLIMQRRVLATANQQWPQKAWSVFGQTSTYRSYYKDSMRNRLSLNW